MENLNAEHIANLLEVEIGFSDGKFTKIEVSALKDALAFINSQEQRIKELTEENERLSLEYEGFEAGAKQLIERLKTQKYMVCCDGTVEIIPTVEQVRADTVRKMKERLHERFHDRVAYTRSYVHDTIDQIAKEMLKDNKNETTHSN